MLAFQRRRLAAAELGSGASWALLWQRRPLVNVRLKWYPSVFREHTGRRCFGLTEEALDLRREELLVLRSSEPDLVDRLCKLLMLTRDRSLPLNAVNQLRWDLGFPSDYLDSLLPRHPDRLRLVRLPEGGGAVDLVRWDDRLAVSELQRNADPGADAEGLAFPIRFTRGFGLKKKCVSWLQEWQTLPYTSPYADASGLDPRTDVSEKRIVGVFHELLHLTLAKKTRRANLSHLRRPLSLPFKFTKVFGRHPGIFYVSQKLATHTIVLREAYGGGRELIQKHPLLGIRERYLELMRRGCIDNRRRWSLREMEMETVEFAP
ncbi:hypothetical protein QJS10_CPA08g00342 [Acorus calamus]|uniref:PORR domain-containing protein n=1 Tax=Acorus calamus TaxID=4465 RepID=A0AAV9EDF1_ACOCL|nr:hypothetical protein QJS10_CPA08g00342 [Acorus calamus]